MKIIYTRKGEPIYVDDWNYDWLVTYGPWHIDQPRRGFGWYARSTKCRQRMHRLICGATDRQVHVDHRDGNGLNNQEANLRVCTARQNNHNRRQRSDNKSGYKGVSWYEPRRKWHAQININGKQTHLGYYKNVEDAHAAYCHAARKYYGEFANLG